MDRLDAMTVLLAVVEQGSLSAASRHLRSPLATVSRKVSELEAHLNAQLLQRSNRKITLTEAGRSYVEAAREILNRVEEAERTAAGEYSAPKGELTMTAPIVFGRLHVLPVVVDFLKAYPDINLRLMLGDRLSNLVEDHIDVALRIGNLPDSNLIATRLGAIRRTVYASPDYLTRHPPARHPGDLAGHDCVTFEGMASMLSWTFTEGKHDLTVPIRSRLAVNTAEAAVDAAVAGLGVTRVLSYQAARAEMAGLLVPLLQDFEPPPAPVHLVYPAQGLVALKLRALLDFATPRLRATLK
ncbi:LysR family transcriptional regulator [Rhizobium leguminosarum]|uniref:HTH-type transcriptional regulator TtuA n=1 Tax=Rhizobium leguminosarum TaxID=384 RepID=A0ABD7PPN6_RHILE|nr:LysR family transcriptional regulator [Rhizobium leguminosarum]TAV72970.1 LysR family transcriptional regulator [Rhizobium leguminosarum]TAV77571.1 LysR family transcriptional regulator [Rhizobium leguminosarum]TAW28950.1 LysR family transcriptional regulator [Rhizobium leguminosarum]TAW42677.1 LysR family transcriptional regulator [Rhizobium leguminosarum]TAX33779.1 LysR family transcriptional regulator [Rhizobium leguminosarum]